MNVKYRGREGQRTHDPQGSASPSRRFQEDGSYPSLKTAL